MAALSPATLDEIEIDENTGYFFKRVGEISFSKPSKSHDVSSAVSLVAVDSRSGACFFSDSNGRVILRGGASTRFAF